jgi:hypothetical protein
MTPNPTDFADSGILTFGDNLRPATVRAFSPRLFDPYRSEIPHFFLEKITLHFVGEFTPH